MPFNNKLSIKRIRETDWTGYIVYLAFLLVFVFFVLTLGPRGFVSSKNILNITRQTAMISIMAVTMTFVIGAGLIDLSVGSIAALSSLVAALTVNSTGSIILGLLAGLVVGCLIGWVNGILITHWNIPSFLVTLGTMGIIRGGAMWLTNTAAVPILNSRFNFLFGTGDIMGIPILFFWTILILLLGLLMIKRTAFGKRILATGGNETASIYSGVKTHRIKIYVMTLSGLIASFAGILYAGRLQAGRYTYGEGDELSVIAAVILGGTGMAGGTGFVFGAVIGSLMMGMINNGLVLGGLSVSQQMIVRGIILILAVAVGNKYQKK